MLYGLQLLEDSVLTASARRKVFKLDDTFPLYLFARALGVELPVPDTMRQSILEPVQSQRHQNGLYPSDHTRGKTGRWP